MPSSLARPGVEVVQEFASTSATIVTPTLVPCIIGPAFEVIDITEADGTINSDAADGDYDQFPQTIAQTDFPSPRSNIDEVDVLEAEIDVYFVQGGSLYQLENGTDPVNPGGNSAQFGEAFLTEFNNATRAGVRTADAVAGYAIENTHLTVALDVPAETDATQDTVISFPDNATVAYTHAEVVAIINAALGDTYAEVVSPAVGNDYIQISSLTYGAGSSLTIRIGSDAADVLFPVAGNFNGSLFGYRVEGSGFRGQDDADGDLTTPWIEFHRGDYREFDGTSWASVAFPGGTSDTPGLLTGDLAATFTSANVPGTAVTFAGAAPTIPLQAATTTDPGDYFYGDGTLIGSGEVIEVQTARFRLGVLDTVNSTFDANGNPTSRVYTSVEVGTPSAGSPLSPRYAWFQARGLQMNNITPAGTAASVEGSAALALAAQAAEIEASVATPAHYNGVSNLTLLFTITTDGVTDSEYTYTFPAAAYANIAAVVAALTADTYLGGLLTFTATAGPPNDLLLINTQATGDDQTVSVAAAGTANATLGFSTTLATSADGKDVEYATQAVIAGSWIDVGNMTGSEILEFTITDHLGADTITLTRPAAAIATFPLFLVELTALLAAQTAIPRVAFTGLNANINGIDQLVITAREGGASVRIQTTANTDDLFGFDLTGPEAFSVATIDVTGLQGTLASETLTFNVDALVDPDFGAIVLTEGALLEWQDIGAGAGNDILTADTIVSAINNDAILSGNVLASNGSVWPAPGTTAVVTVTSIPAGSFGDLMTVVAGGPLIPTTVTFAGGEDIIGDSNGAEQIANNGVQGADLLNGEDFGFWLDGAACEILVTASSNSLADLIEAINNETGGYVVASVGTVSTSALLLTSQLIGMASQVEINGEDGAGSGTENLGFNVDPAANSSASGTGRPNPDFYLDVSGSVNIGAQIFRNTMTGVPDCPISSTIYVAYRGLRLDVSPSAASPGLITVEDSTELLSVMDPISEDNPLALGMYFALLNAPGVTVAGIGVDEVTGTEEHGTPLAYTGCFEFLEAQEVYALAVLTHNAIVHQNGMTHVDFMSDSDQKGERILFFNPEVPTEDVSTVAQSGTGEVSSITNVFLLDANPSAALTANGVNPALPLDIDDGVYLTVEVNGVSYNYLVTAVSGVTLTLSTTFLATENLDGFYTTTDLAGPVPNVAYSLQIRGDELVIAGSSLPDLGGIATTVQTVGLAYGNRRMYYVFPDSCTATLGGPTLELEGFYMCAAIAGMVGQQPPQQPFTNLPVTGFSGVQGSNDTYRESHLDTMAGGGVYIMIQEADGAPIISRHQLSTNVTTIETRELSITKAVDYTAKFMRAGLRNFIGRYNITAAFLDTLSSVVQGQLAFLAESGVIIGGYLNSITQDTTNPDTVLIDIGLEVAYPCNYIRLTLIV